MILRSLLIVATPYVCVQRDEYITKHMCDTSMTHACHTSDVCLLRVCVIRNEFVTFMATRKIKMATVIRHAANGITH